MKTRLLAVAAWAALGGFLYLAGSDFYEGVVLMGNPPSLASRRVLVFPFLALGLALLWLVGLRAVWQQRPPALVLGWQSYWSARPLWLRIPAAVLFLLLPAYLLIYSSFGSLHTGYWLRLALLLGAAAGGTLALFPRPEGSAWLLRTAWMVCVAGALYVCGDWLSTVTGYPFSLSWSEGNRIWDYSLMFGSERYINPSGKAISAFISTGRQFLWSLPFLLPGIGIFGVRLWDALLWIVPPLLLAWATFAGERSLRVGLAWKAGLCLWMLVFLAQGPIYAPLLVSAILVVIAVRQRYLAAAVVLVALAAYYATISRFTWIYAAGLWAGMLSLLSAERPAFTRAGWRALVRPVTLGLAGYFGGQTLPGLVSAISRALARPERAARILTSVDPTQTPLLVDPSADLARQPLLWERLWPNPTYPPGLFLGLLWACLPLVAVLLWLAARRIWKPNLLQGLGVLGPTLAFLGVGIVVSVKIGGGSNLHNLDMFLISLALIAAWAWRDLARTFPWTGASKTILNILLSLALIAPPSYAMQYGRKLSLPSPEAVERSLETLRLYTRNAQKHGEVLFIDQRQLLTFGLAGPVALVPEYEKKHLMDEALAGNQAYFAKFYQDLADHRFALIVSEPMRANYQGDAGTFSQENDAWVEWVANPVLCYYLPVLNLNEAGVQLLYPRSFIPPAMEEVCQYR